MTGKITLFWFRQDLRIADNPALFEAAQNGAVMPIYILDTDTYKIGAASQWWLHHSLNALNKSLENTLNVYVGSARSIIFEILQKNTVHAVYWNRCYDPQRIAKDSLIKTELKNINIECKSFNGSLLWEPWEVLKNDKTHYKVFTPFYRECLQIKSPRHPLPKPEKLTLIKDVHNSTTLKSLELLPKINWHEQMQSCWKIGEYAAQSRLIEFLEDGLQGYKEDRNYPVKENVSRLSPHLHFGEISPNQVWHGAQGLRHDWAKDSDCFLSELGWREFSHSLLYHFSDLANENFQKKFNAFPWVKNPLYLKAWQTGQTGYPIVDAGMRELWQTGYMHNRVRMIVGSFLVRIPVNSIADSSFIRSLIPIQIDHRFQFYSIINPRKDILIKLLRYVSFVKIFFVK